MSPYRLEFQLPGLPKMTNAKSSLKHWGQLSKEANVWKRTLFLYLASKKPPQPLEHAKLTLTRGSSVQPDYDGLVSGFKHVIDGLVLAKVLINDDQETIGIPEYKWVKADPKEGFIRVTVEEIFTNGF